MTGISSGIGDGARRPAPPILPFDVARRPRYTTASSPWPGEDDGRQKATRTSRQSSPEPPPPAPQRPAPPAVSNPIARDDVPAPIRLRRIAERFGDLAAAAGDDAAFADAAWLAGRLAVAGDDLDGKPTALALGLLRRPTEHRWETRLAKIERYAEIREIAARYPDLKRRKLWRAVIAECGYSEGTVRRALED